jgi:hypothetical protein
MDIVIIKEHNYLLKLIIKFINIIGKLHNLFKITLKSHQLD